MHHTKAEYFLFHIIYVTQLFVYDIGLMLTRMQECLEIFNSIVYLSHNIYSSVYIEVNTEIIVYYNRKNPLLMCYLSILCLQNIWLTSTFIR